MKTDAEKHTDISTRWFGEHIAKDASPVVCAPSDNPPVRIIRWAKPGTGIDAVTYIIYKAHLFVSGDLGEAVYQWNRPIGLEFLASLDLSYFASKCRASEVGTRFVEWDPAAAEEVLEDHFAGMREDSTEDEAKARSAYVGRGGVGAIASRDEWNSWLVDHAYEVFGDDWYEWAPRVGKRVHMRCHAHLIGLQMAAACLSAAKKETKSAHHCRGD